MKLGILNAIPPELSQVDWQGSPVDAYVRFLDQVDNPFTYRGYAITAGELPATPDECDAYLITGSPRGAYDADPWIGALIRFIRRAHDAGQQFVGICFGHQVLAHALGGRVEKWPQGQGLGLDRFAVTAQRPWMTTQPEACALYFAHGDQVLELPPGADLLGGNSRCPNAMYEIDDRVLGIQGHPEFTRTIMEGIVAEMDAQLTTEQRATVLASLDAGTPDGLLFARWIVRFLTGNSTP